MTQTRTIRWLIAHQPEELFLRTARAFANELKKLGENSLEVDILTYPEYVAKYGAIPELSGMKYNPDDSESFEKGIARFWQALTDSDIEMSQMQVVRIGELCKDFYALDLPYLFDDHDHASRVLDGEIGQELCDRLGEQSGVKGLAFTYSGGFRMIGSVKPLYTLDDVISSHVAVQNPLSLAETLKDLGGTYSISSPNLWHKHDPMGPNGDCDAVESTYLRFEHTRGKHVLRTNHSMFLTTIVVSNTFWNSLTPEQQTNFSTAAKEAAKIERQWSIEDAEKYENNAEKNGITIRDLPEEDKIKLRRRSQVSYFKSKYWFTPDLVKRIRTR
jgi:TRAP-type C4-dicarboxylate transport system substrate-binding protein